MLGHLFCNKCGNTGKFNKKVRTTGTVDKNRRALSGSQGKKHKVMPATREIRYYCSVCDALLEYVHEVRKGQRWIPANRRK